MATRRRRKTSDTVAFFPPNSDYENADEDEEEPETQPDPNNSGGFEYDSEYGDMEQTPESRVKLRNTFGRTGEVEDERTKYEDAANHDPTTRMGFTPIATSDEVFAVVDNVGNSKLMPKMVGILIAIVLILFVIAILSTRYSSELKFTDLYKSEDASIIGNAWSHQLAILRAGNICPEKIMQHWMSEWRIYGDARHDGRSHWISIGPPLSIVRFDNALRNYTAKHRFGCSALVKYEAGFPIPKACACVHNETVINVYYFFCVHSISSKKASAVEMLHYLPQHRQPWEGPYSITVRYITNEMNKVYEKIVFGEEVVCIMRCVELTDNIDYLNPFIN